MQSRVTYWQSTILDIQRADVATGIQDRDRCSGAGTTAQRGLELSLRSQRDDAVCTRDIEVVMVSGTGPVVMVSGTGRGGISVMESGTETWRFPSLGFCFISGTAAQGGGAYDGGLVAITVPSGVARTSGNKCFAIRPLVISIPELLALRIPRAEAYRPGGVATKTCFAG
jgi:hypothetical protein